MVPPIAFDGVLKNFISRLLVDTPRRHEKLDHSHTRPTQPEGRNPSAHATLFVLSIAFGYPGLLSFSDEWFSNNFFRQMCGNILGGTHDMKLPHFPALKKIETSGRQDEKVFAEASELALLRLEQCIADLRITVPKKRNSAPWTSAAEKTHEPLLGPPPPGCFPESSDRIAIEAALDGGHKR